MPFSIAGDEALTEKIAVRLTPDEKTRLQEDAAIAGLTVSALVRRRYFGRPIVARADAATIRELRRLGGLLKLVHRESGGAYSADTAAALVTVREALAKLAAGAERDRDR